MPTHREHQALPSRWLNIPFFGYNKIQYIYNLPANSTLSFPIATAHKNHLSQAVIENITETAGL